MRRRRGKREKKIKRVIDTVLTVGCEQDQGKQEQKTALDSSHGAGGPWSS